MAMNPDTAILEGLRSGEGEAQNRFYRDYRKRLYPVCVHFLGPQDAEAEDVLQQTFVVALEKIGQFEGRSSLYTWMAHICVNLCYERLRRRKRQLATLETDLDRLLAPRAEQEARQEASDDLRGKRLAALREKMKLLGEPCKAILGLRDVEGLSYAEVGKKLGIPLGTVMSRLARCRETLKRMIQGMDEGKLP